MTFDFHNKEPRHQRQTISVSCEKAILSGITCHIGAHLKEKGREHLLENY
jgi:hypothetical protein